METDIPCIEAAAMRNSLMVSSLDLSFGESRGSFTTGRAMMAATSLKDYDYVYMSLYVIYVEYVNADMERLL